MLLRPMSSTLAHNIMVASMCMKLHNLGVDNSVTWVKPHVRDFRDHDRLLVVPQSIVVDNAPRDLKAKVKSSLRDFLVILGKTGGESRPLRTMVKGLGLARI